MQQTWMILEQILPIIEDIETEIDLDMANNSVTSMSQGAHSTS